MWRKAEVDMVKAGGEKHRQLIGVKHRSNKACVLPEDLYKKVVKALYQLCEWGVPEKDATEVGKIVIDNYWRNKNADKNGK